MRPAGQGSILAFLSAEAHPRAAEAHAMLTPEKPCCRESSADGAHANSSAVCQGVSLYIPQATINATVKEDILLSVEYSCHGVPTIEWTYSSNWGTQKIVEWKPGTQANISQSHKDRVCTFDNGSIQLFSVGVRDSGYYVITVTERLGSSQFGTIVLHVSEILYEDLHFVAVILAFLAAVAAVLISLMWVCNKCAYKFQRKRRHKLKESTTEEIELEDVEC
ncbi:V-set and transmembrane domain-containing protein 5 [Piliocolobus tephrosceles]|uniref:V-set and transmembrane domain-containing protein 5 n=1 Tax=Piliocolobus tephrosceles TaxID=591936 RepID=UPI001301966B|nr:V-set and transmembrane domain-containing protein 5 [Piliocolobus tephrosceles]